MSVASVSSRKSVYKPLMSPHNKRVASQNQLARDPVESSVAGSWKGTVGLFDHKSDFHVDRHYLEAGNNYKRLNLRAGNLEKVALLNMRAQNAILGDILDQLKATKDLTPAQFEVMLSQAITKVVR